MKNTLSLLSRLFLVMCLGLYGPLGMATAGNSDGLLPMVICADGVTQTVLLGADGAPVEPDVACSDCLTCCNAIGVNPKAEYSDSFSVTLMDLGVDIPAFQRPVFSKRNTLPVPRGPPLVHSSMQVLPEPVGFDQLITGHKQRCNGRPHLKDADA